MVPAADIYVTLTDIFQRVFGQGQGAVTADMTSHTIAGWDSFKYVRVILELEAAFGIELDGPEIDDVRDVGDLVLLVQTKIQLIGET